MSRLDRLARLPLVSINGATPAGSSSSPAPETPCPGRSNTSGASTGPTAPPAQGSGASGPSNGNGQASGGQNVNPRAQLGQNLADDDLVIIRRRKRRLTRAEKKKAKQQALSATEQDDEELLRIGRLFGKFCCPFTPVAEVLAAGAKLEKHGGDALSRAEKYKAAEWLDIKDRYPEILGLLQRRGKEYVAERLHQHRADMLSEDCKRCKIHAPEWHTWVPAIAATDAGKKELRGLKHDGMAALLMPQDEDWSSAEVKAKYAPDGEPSKGAKLEHDQLPRLLFRADDPRERNEPGLLCGEVLKPHARGLLLGPGMAGKPNGKGSKTCLAGKYSIKDVTTTFMAYVACIVRYAISAEPKFGQNGEYGFNYVGLFHRIKKAIDVVESCGANGEGLDIMLEIKSSWEKAIFVDVVYSESEDGTDDEDEDEMRGRYDGFIAKRARLTAEAAAASQSPA